MDMSDYAEPLPTELEQIVDEARRDCGLGPAPRAAGTGIADMQARIQYHTNLRSNLIKQLNALPVKATAARKDLDKLISSCDRQLDEARVRLRNYEVQQKSLN